jgi:hypothetical protein
VPAGNCGRPSKLISRFNVSARKPFPPIMKRSRYKSKLAPPIGLLWVNGVYSDGEPVPTWPSTAEVGMFTGGEPPLSAAPGPRK